MDNLCVENCLAKEIKFCNIEISLIRAVQKTAIWPLAMRCIVLEAPDLLYCNTGLGCDFSV